MKVMNKVMVDKQVYKMFSQIILFKLNKNPNLY